MLKTSNKLHTAGNVCSSCKSALTGDTVSAATGAVACPVRLRSSVTTALLTPALKAAVAVVGTCTLMTLSAGHVTAAPRLHVTLALVVSVGRVDSHTAAQQSAAGSLLIDAPNVVGKTWPRDHTCVRWQEL
jgi:hypothetical protein